MGRLPLLLITVLAVACAAGCEKRSETPPEVARAYTALVGTLDSNTPGASVARLKAFARRNSGYAISSAVDADLKAWRGRLDSAYLKGRDLVREEEFDRAEAIMKDLAQLPDERAGRMARDFLAFDFYNMKATRLLQKGDIAGAEAAARTLRSRPLTEGQLAAAERLLDTAGTVGMGVRMVRVAAMQSAARMLQVFLYSSYADDGQYPRTLTLDSPALASLRNTGAFSSVVGSIEDYTATQDEFSCVVVGKDPRQRFRVTHRAIEEIR